MVEVCHAKENITRLLIIHQTEKNDFWNNLLQRQTEINMITWHTDDLGLYNIYWQTDRNICGGSRAVWDIQEARELDRLTGPSSQTAVASEQESR